MANVEVYCALCKQGSHRDDWQGKTEVFCDTHTADEIKAYRASKTPKAPPAPPTQNAKPGNGPTTLGTGQTTPAAASVK
jgi:hypothetical protein